MGKPLNRTASIGNKDTGDFGVEEFVSILRRLNARPPVTEDFESKIPKTKDCWYRTQKQHMTSWFQAQTTKGAGNYTRNSPNRSAKRTYNRLLSPGGVLWIGEALGVDPKLVQKAAKEALAEPQYRRRCGIIRKHIPWEMINEKARNRLRR